MKIEERVKKAYELHHAGYNCAQAVLKQASRHSQVKNPNSLGEMDKPECYILIGR